MFEFLVMKAFR